LPIHLNNGKVSTHVLLCLIVMFFFSPSFTTIREKPIFGLWAMIWFLAIKRRTTTIAEIATTFTGMFYLGYVPSFWVRIRLIGGGREPTRLAPLVGPILSLIERSAKTALPSYVPTAIHLPITTGAIFIFWTWLCLAFRSVLPYYSGRTLKTKVTLILSGLFLLFS
jgi:hypothetical protein